MRDKVMYLVGIAASMIIGSSAAMLWPEPVHAATHSVEVCANMECVGILCEGVFPGLNCDHQGTSCAVVKCP
jgi:hypothetical protein